MSHAALILAVAAICTYITRAAPFWLFRGNGKLPSSITYLGKSLPGAIMATLVVYCLRSTSFMSPGTFVPQLVAVAVVVLLHLLKRNTLLSIFGGTAVYMVIVQNLF